MGDNGPPYLVDGKPTEVSWVCTMYIWSIGIKLKKPIIIYPQKCRKATTTRNNPPSGSKSPSRIMRAAWRALTKAGKRILRLRVLYPLSLTCSSARMRERTEQNNCTVRSPPKKIDKPDVSMRMISSKSHHCTQKKPRCQWRSLVVSRLFWIKVQNNNNSEKTINRFVHCQPLSSPPVN